MAVKVSVIIPVYNASKTLRRCVESLVLGKERNIDIILIDDCSSDDSWIVCTQLAGEFKNVKCLQNEKNSGVSYTRNQGLKVANGKFVLFVDSDDWVSENYISVLVRTAEENTKKLVLCGYHFMDYLSGKNSLFLYGENGKTEIDRVQLFSLVDSVLVQQLWNKIFYLDVIRYHQLQFDENQSMGEDFQFVLDYMKVAEVESCLVVNQPLYYYIRAGKNSLMSKFGLTEREVEFRRYYQLWELTLCQEETKESYLNAIKSVKTARCYQIVHSDMSKREKLQSIEETMQDGAARKYYRNLRKVVAKEKLYQCVQKSGDLLKKIKWKLLRLKRKRIIKNVKSQLKSNEFTIISQNCIGGVFYHDMGVEFQSPTINLYFSAADFVKFVLNLKKYLSLTPQMSWEETYPVGMLGDIKINFMHYQTCTEALEAWERRKKRVHWNKIIVCATDREGFDEKVFQQWKQIPYQKVLFTAQKKFSDELDSVYYPEYEKMGEVPDLIPERKFYRESKILIEV